MPGRSITLIACSMLMALAGCGGIPLARPDEMRLAQQYAPDPDFALIYIFRNSPEREAWELPVAIGSRRIGKLQGDQFAMLKVRPGAHDIIASVGTPFYYSENDGHCAVTSLRAEKGSIHFVQLSLVRKGSYIVPTLNAVSEQVGKRAVSDSKLIRLQEENIWDREYSSDRRALRARD